VEWTQILALLLGNLAIILPLWLWNRAESRADIRHIDSRMDAIRELTHAIHLEIKDFHGRLCAIEERNRSK
jgi:hypothetical protein